MAKGIRKVAMLAQHRKHLCTYCNCTPEYGHKAHGSLLRRQGRRKENANFKKEIVEILSKPAY